MVRKCEEIQIKGITGVQAIQGYYYYLDLSVISLTSHGAKTFISKDTVPVQLDNALGL